MQSLLIAIYCSGQQYTQRSSFFTLGKVLPSIIGLADRVLSSRPYRNKDNYREINGGLGSILKWWYVMSRSVLSFTSFNTELKVESQWSGLRPLVKDGNGKSKAVSRKQLSNGITERIEELKRTQNSFKIALPVKCSWQSLNNDAIFSILWTALLIYKIWEHAH